MKKNTTSVSLLVDNELLESFRQVARNNMRSVTGEIRFLMQRRVEEQKAQDSRRSVA